MLIREKTPEDDEWLVDLRNRLGDPLPPSTVESFRHWERVDSISEKSHNERLIAERDGERVGAMVLEKMWWTERLGGFYVSINVEESRWGRGIGTALFDWAVSRLGQLQAERIYGNVRNDRPHAQQFVDRRGFQKTGNAQRWSRLEVDKANLDGYEGAENSLALSGITISTLSEAGATDDLLRKLHLLHDEAVRDIPMSETFTETPFELFLEEMNDPDISPERVWIAMAEAEPVGIALLPVKGPLASFNGFTGVKRAYRGRGVARALKLRTVQWCHDHKVKFIYTANDVNNKRMLAINNSLGYQELPIGEEVVKHLS